MAGTSEVGRRICVIGNGGAGKSYVARGLAERLGLRYIDRDALVWRAGWTPVPRDERAAIFDAATRDGGWTFDGHLRSSRPDERLVLERCDTIVWLDLPRWQTLSSMAWRSLRRVIMREPLPNGNVERWQMLVSPEFSVRWAWKNHAPLRAEYEALFARERAGPRCLVKLESRRAVARWLAGVRAEPP